MFLKFFYFATAFHVLMFLFSFNFFNKKLGLHINAVIVTILKTIFKLKLEILNHKFLYALFLFSFVLLILFSNTLNLFIKIFSELF